MRLPSLLLSSATLALAVLMSGCSHAGKTPSAKMVGYRETTRAWISDGSLARFSDTVRLPKTGHEGWVDQQVAIRYASVAPNESGYDGEAEWVVEFAEPVAKLAAANRLDLSTKVRLRGLIEGKDLKGLSRPGRAPWVPFSLGNNVLTDGGTPWMTLGELDQQGDRFTVEVKLPSRGGKEFFHHSKWSDVARNRKSQPSATVLGIAHGFHHWASTKYPEWSDITLLNVAAQGRNSAFVNEPGRRWKAAAGTLAHPLETLEGTVRGGLGAAQLRTRLGRQISAHDAAVAGRIEMVLRDEGKVAGRATLNLISTFTSR